MLAKISKSKSKHCVLMLQVGIAHMLELYDFTLFVVLLPVMVKHFFPMYEYGQSMMLGYLAFAISFLIAPFGSIIWGYIGDKFGSNRIFRASLFIMAFPSLTIALLPTYEHIGIAAPILLMLLRIFQGVSASGAILGSKIFVFDRVPQSSYLQASSIISGFGALGVLMAMLCGGYAAIYQDMWRLPFFIGGAAMFLILLVRNLTVKPQQIKPYNSAVTLLSFWTVLKEKPIISLQALAISGALGGFSYFMHSFMVNMQVSIMSRSLENAYYTARFTLIGAITASLLTAIFFAKLHQSAHTMLRNLSLYCAAACTPLYLTMLNANTEALIYTIMMGFGLLLGTFAAFSSVVVIGAFSKEQRCRGALLANSFGVALCGGTTPLLMSFLASFSAILPAIVLSLGFFSLFMLLRTNTSR